MIDPAILAALASGGAASTLVAAVRSWLSTKKSQKMIKIEAGDKEWTIDAEEMSSEEIRKLLEALSADIESETEEAPNPPIDPGLR
jgi:Effector Associated Constant Component 1